MEGSLPSTAGAGLLLHTDGLTKTRHNDELFGLYAVSATLGALTDRGHRRPARARVAEFAYGTLTADLCMLAARIN